MSNSTHQIKVKGVDATGKAFDSIAARAKATGASIRAALGGALAAAGAYLSIRSVAGAVKELGKLSDLAMKAGTSVEFLTKSATAFQVAGLDIAPESLTKAMQMMQKNTGQRGEGAFFEIAKQIAAIPDEAERAQAAVKVFGRSGLDLLPLVNNGAEAIEKFQTLQSILPGVSDAAARAGDAAADALTIFGKGAQSLMLRVVGKIAALWGEDFPGGVRAGALNAINALDAFFKKAWAKMTNWGAKIGNFFGAFENFFTNGYTWDQAWAEFSDLNARLDELAGQQIAAINTAREDYKAKLATLNVDDLAGAFGPQRLSELSGESFGAAAAKAISNKLILAGSNESRLLQVMGPQVNEAKKQTAILEKIAKNTEKTAENTEEGGEQLAVTDLS